MNQKVQRLNELNALYSEKVADLNRRYNSRRSEIDERVLARTGGNIRGMLSGGLAALKKEFEDARQTILADIQTQGADELALMPSLQTHFNRDPGVEVPSLTSSHVAVALSEARSKSSLQLRKLSQMRTDLRERSKNRGSRLNYNDLKGDLMRLVRSNPVSVGRMLASNPEYSDNLCRVNRTMKTDQMIDQFWDSSFLVIAGGVGVASIIATGGASTPLVIAAVGAVSVGLTVADVGVSQLRINESARRQDEIIAAVLAGLGDDASYEDLQVAVGQERSARLQQNLALALAPLEAFAVADIARAAARAPARAPAAAARPAAVPTQRATPVPAATPNLTTANFRQFDDIFNGIEVDPGLRNLIAQNDELLNLVSENPQMFREVLNDAGAQANLYSDLIQNPQNIGELTEVLGRLSLRINEAPLIERADLIASVRQALRTPSCGL